jgi:hypothetical protein
VTHFTKSFPKRADITGSPEQAFNMQDSREKYLKNVLGGITPGSIVALGSIATGGSFQYLYAPQIHHDLGGQPIGIGSTSSNKMGEFSCVYMNLSNFKLFPFVEPTASMSRLLKHTEVTQLSTNHLNHTTDWKDIADPIRGTLLPNFFIVYFGQEIPQRIITSDDEKTTMAKLGSGYDLWVSTVSDAIDNMDDIDYVIDAFGTVDNLSLSAFYKKHFYRRYEETTSLPILRKSLRNNYHSPIQRLLSGSRGNQEDFLPDAAGAPPGSSNFISPHPSASGRCQKGSCSQGRYKQVEVVPHLWND